MELNYRIINEFLSQQRFETTADSYRKALNQFYEWSQGKNWDCEQGIQDYYYHLLQSRTLNDNSMMNYMRIVKSFVNWLFKKGLVERNFADSFETHTIKGFLKDRIYADGYERLLATFDNLEVSFKSVRNYAMILLMARVGLREIELSRANRRDLQARQNRPVLHVQSKGKKSREDYVHLNEYVFEAVREYLDMRTDNDEALFVRSDTVGGRLSTRSIRAIATRHLEMAGLKSDRVTVHSLRHEAASRAIEEGADPIMVQRMMRHKHFSTTELYINELERSKRGAEFLDY